MIAVERERGGLGMTLALEAEQEAARERARLVRLCARLSGSAEAAEDLAQETLLEAWRQAHKLREPAGRDRWLAAIARNVCLRWSRSCGRWGQSSVVASSDAALEVADLFDLEYELERGELAELLDRALTLLPEPTRRILLGRYVEESPLAEIAARLGLSEAAVSMRLTRGKQQLRRLLGDELREEALAFGLAHADDSWQETRLWCAMCGSRHLQMRLSSAPAVVSFRCPDCDREPDVPGSIFPLTNTAFAQLVGELRRPSAILKRTTAWVHDYFRRALAEREIPCTNCGRPAPLQMTPSPEPIPWYAEPLRELPRLTVVCDACGEGCSSSFAGLVGALPEVRRFRREHPRVRILPPREVEAAGRDAVVLGFESLARTARIEVVSARQSFDLIGLHQSPAPPA